MKNLVYRLLTNQDILRMGDLYEENYKKPIKDEKTDEDEFMEMATGVDRKPPISYRDWDKTVAVGKDPIELTKKYWIHISEFRDKNMSPLKYIDWLYKEESQLARASEDKQFQDRVVKQDRSRMMRFNLKSFLILNGLFYSANIF